MSAVASVLVVRRRGEVMPVPQITGQIHISRPPATVFDVVADERNRYDPSIRHAELLTDGPIGAGTCFRTVADGIREPVEMTVEITHYDRPRRLDTTTHTASMDIDSTLLFDPVDTGTRMSWSLQFRPRGSFRLLTPVLPLIGRRQLRRVWNALEAYVELPWQPRGST